MNLKLTIASMLALSACTGANSDRDEDGLTLEVEEQLGLDPDSADSDGDGLNDGAELDAGADPLVQDTDGDRLLDGEEAALGADPTLIDTDGDSYNDGDEVFEGKDPGDPKSKIYTGKWPYYFEKTELAGNGGAELTVGKRFKRLKMIDQHGDEVDLYDFYNADKPVVIDVSAEWCPPCNSLSAWLDGEEDPYYDSIWPGGPAAVKRGDVYWVTVIGETNAGEPDGTGELAARWFEEYPSKQIPVLDDPNYLAADYVQLGFWPTAYLLEPDLTASASTTDGYVETVLAELNSRFPE